MRKRLSVFLLLACGGVHLALLWAVGPIEAAAADEVRDDRPPHVLLPKPGLTAAKVDSSAPSVVLLPPRFHASAGPQLVVTADLACDRLLQEIAAAGLARVVDRTQLDRMLQERSFQAQLPQPMLSYDAMIRMEVDASRLVPETNLCIIDLSTGNIMKEQKFGWPLEEADLPSMLSLCREVLKGVKKPADGKQRVRTLWRENAIANERMRPLGKRLIEVFDEALQRSNRVVLVRHLEAATSKEESLLLLMGLSRLPGGRQFSPQADATIELRIDEGDGQGKTFPETPVEIGIRLRKGGGYEGQWVTTVGLVRDFDAMISQAWQKLSQSLGEVHAETAGTLLNEMSLRRRQAETELQVVNDLRAVAADERGAGDSRERHLKAALEALPHAEAAAKLDPTSPKAAEAVVQTLADISCNDYMAPRRMPDAAIRTVREAARYTERFRQDSQLCERLFTFAFYGLCRSPLRQLLVRSERGELSWLTIEDEDSLVLTPEAVRDLDLVKRLLQRWSDDDAAMRSVYAAKYMTVVTYRGMRSVNIPATERQAWLEEISRRCLAKNATAKRPSRHARTVQNGQELAASSSPATIAGTSAGTTPAAMAAASRLSAWNEVAQMQLWIARLLVEEAQVDQIKQIVRQVQEEAPANRSQSHITVRLMHDVVADCHDPQLLADFEQWCKGLDQQPPHPLWVKWPLMDVFADRNRLQSPTRALDGNLGDDAPPVQFLTIRVRPQTGPTYHWRYSPLARGDGRLYFVRSQVQFAGAHPYDIIAYVPLDDQNRPIGKANPESDGFWDSVSQYAAATTWQISLSHVSVVC